LAFEVRPESQFAVGKGADLNTDGSRRDLTAVADAAGQASEVTELMTPAAPLPTKMPLAPAEILPLLATAPARVVVSATKMPISAAEMTPLLVMPPPPLVSPKKATPSTKMPKPVGDAAVTRSVPRLVIPHGGRAGTIQDEARRREGNSGSRPRAPNTLERAP
jgi:hypothetical protein